MNVHLSPLGIRDGGRLAPTHYLMTLDHTKTATQNTPQYIPKIAIASAHGNTYFENITCANIGQYKVQSSLEQGSHDITSCVDQDQVAFVNGYLPRDTNITL